MTGRGRPLAVFEPPPHYFVIPKLPLNRFSCADGATYKVPISRTGNVCSFYRQRSTILSLLVRVSSSRSASVSCCPHSQAKKVRAERQTDSGPPSTTFSPHSSQIRTTCLPEPTTSTPSASLLLRGRHPLILTWSPQGEPASTMRDLCFTRYCLNPELRFRLVRRSGSASRAGPPD
jgi:hypothetical protein